MEKIPDKSIDMVLCDLPYGTTANKWDNIIDFNKLWQCYERIIKDDGIIVLFSTQPFTSLLITSNMEMFRYSWVWKKDGANGFLNANYAPLKISEDICVFSKATVGSLSKNKIRYNPQGIVKVDRQKINNVNSGYRESQGYESKNNLLNSGKEYVQKYTNYPTNILEFKRDLDNIHPTQKPVKLLEYLIKTYTEKGQTVLDNCMGSGSTGVACINTERKFIGIEIESRYFDIAKQRIEKAVDDSKYKQMTLFDL